MGTFVLHRISGKVAKLATESSLLATQFGYLVLFVRSS